jgi:hypothetical protein
LETVRWVPYGAHVVVADKAVELKVLPTQPEHPTIPEEQEDDDSDSERARADTDEGEGVEVSVLDFDYPSSLQDAQIEQHMLGSLLIISSSTPPCRKSLPVPPGGMRRS